MSVDDFLTALERQGSSQTVAELRRFADVIWNGPETGPQRLVPSEAGTYLLPTTYNSALS